MNTVVQIKYYQKTKFNVEKNTSDKKNCGFEENMYLKFFTFIVVVVIEVN